MWRSLPSKGILTQSFLGPAYYMLKQTLPLEIFILICHCYYRSQLPAQFSPRPRPSN